MNKIGSFFRLVRWPNLLIITLMMCLVYHCVIMMQSSTAFTLFVISMVLVVAGGYVINDIFDVETDSINKPDKVIVGGVFSERQSEMFYWALTIIGLCCGMASSIIAFGSRFYLIFACLLLLAGILYSYSSTYKKKLIIGNVIVSLSVAFAVFLPWLYVLLYMLGDPLLLQSHGEFVMSSFRIVLIYTAFAFLATMIREIIKDMEDADGDGRTHCRTIPVVWGGRTAGYIAEFLILLLFVLLIFVMNHSESLRVSEVTSYALFLICVLLFVVFVTLVMLGREMMKNPEKILHGLSVIMKIIILIGVLSMGFVNFNR